MNDLRVVLSDQESAPCPDSGFNFHKIQLISIGCKFDVSYSFSLPNDGDFEKEDQRSLAEIFC